MTPNTCSTSSYRGQTEIIHRCAPRARDCTQHGCGYKDHIDVVERAKNRTKSRVRRKFGFVKVRYLGLKKNANRLPPARLVNLFVSRKKLNSA